MTDKSRQILQQEWTTLHNNVEQSETMALIIKLLAVVICFAAISIELNLIVIVLLLFVLWFQEAIWKTFQSRTEQRLLDIEKALLNKEENSSLCFYSQWVTSRPGTKALILQYLKNAFRPTIAYPYAVLQVISFSVHFFKL